MPSLPPDLTDPALGADAPPVPTDVLERVKTEGLRRRRRRHTRNGVLAALGLVVAAVPAIALLPGGDGDGDGDRVQVATEADASTTVTTVPSTDTTVPSTVVTTETSVDDSATTVPVAPPSTAVSPTTAAAPPPPATTPTTAATPPPPPPNQPLTASFVSAPASAVVGEQVTFVVAWSDPDAQFHSEHFSTDGVGLGRACTSERGATPPSTPQPGSGERTYTYTFDAPGTYEVVVSLATGSASCDDPFASETTVHHVISVTVP